MFTIFTPLYEFIFLLDDTIFGRHKLHYSPSKHILTLPIAGGAAVAIFFLFVNLIMNIDQAYTLEMSYYLLGAVIALNILIYFYHIITMDSLAGKIGYLIFCATLTVITAVISFILFTVIMLIALALLVIWCLGKAADGPSYPVYSGGGGGGGGGGGSGGSFVRRDQDSYTLSNGDQVTYDPLSGNYASTNPLFPAQYEKNGNDFTEV